MKNYRTITITFLGSNENLRVALKIPPNMPDFTKTATSRYILDYDGTDTVCSIYYHCQGFPNYEVVVMCESPTVLGLIEYKPAQTNFWMYDGTGIPFPINNLDCFEHRNFRQARQDNSLS